jgi:hypothetical protein
MGWRSRVASSVIGVWRWQTGIRTDSGVAWSPQPQLCRPNTSLILDCACLPWGDKPGGLEIKRLALVVRAAAEVLIDRIDCCILTVGRLL